MKIEPNAFRYTNLARSSLISACTSQFKESIYSMKREEKFALYTELDKQIVETAIELARASRQETNVRKELEDFFGEAASIVVNKYTQS